MNKKIAIMGITLITTLCFIINLTMIINRPDYKRDMIITSIEQTEAGERLIVLEDINGYEWEYFTTNFQVGDTVIVSFKDNHTTETIFDDIITKIEILNTANSIR